MLTQEEMVRPNIFSMDEMHSRLHECMIYFFYNQPRQLVDFKIFNIFVVCCKVVTAEINIQFFANAKMVDK